MSLILAVIAVFFLITFAFGNLNLGSGGKKKVLAAVIGLSVATVLGFLTYWSVYAKDETWGDDPQTDLVTLGMATLTAAAGGYAAVRKYVGSGDSPKAG